MTVTSQTTDTTLTHDGLEPTGRGKVLLVACGALAHEILALKTANGWTHLDLQCLPAIYHVHPEKIVPAVRDVVSKRQQDYDSVFVVYADCGTGGQLQQACDELGVAMVEGPHCYSFFEGNETFAAKGEVTKFYLTDFLVRQFDAFVRKPLGLDRHPELRDAYFGNYTGLVYQSQLSDPNLVALAKSYADELGLEFEHRHTGYGDLQKALSSL